jgi:hypothetical protein
MVRLSSGRQQWLARISLFRSTDRLSMPSEVNHNL